MEVVGIKMSRFEVIDRNSIIDINFKVFIIPFDDSIWSVIWWLKGFTDSTMPDENMGSS